MLDIICKSVPDVLQELSGHLSPRALCRLSGVNLFFRSAASADRIWGRFFSMKRGEDNDCYKVAFRKYYERQLSQVKNYLGRNVFSLSYWENLSPQKRAILNELVLYSIEKERIRSLDSFTDFVSSLRSFMQKYPFMLWEFFGELNEISSLSQDYEALMEFLNGEYHERVGDNQLWPNNVALFVP